MPLDFGQGGFLGALGQGLRGAGAVFSPQVYGAQNEEERLLMQIRAQQQRIQLETIVQGVREGSISPNDPRAQQALQALGVGGLGPTPQTQAAQLRLKQEQEASELIRKAFEAQQGAGGQDVAQAGGIRPGGLRDPALLQAAASNPVFAERMKHVADLEHSLQPRLPTGARVNLEHYTDESLQQYAKTGDWSVLRAKPKEDSPTANAKDVTTMLEARGLKKGTPEFQSAFGDEMQKLLTKREGLTVKVTGGGVSGGKDDGTKMSDDALDNNAFLLLSTGKYPTNMGRGVQGARQRTLIDNRAAEMMNERGIRQEELPSIRAQYTAQSRSLVPLQNYLNRVDQFLDGFNRNIEVLNGTIEKGVGKSVPLLNTPINALRSKFGDADFSAFQAALNTVGREYGRIMTGPASNAQLTVHAQQLSQELLNPNMTPKQLKAVLDIMGKDTKNMMAASESIMKQKSKDLERIVPDRRKKETTDDSSGDKKDDPLGIR